MDGNQVPDLDDIGNIFFRDGYRMASEYLAEGISKSRLVSLMTAAYEAVDGLIDSFRNRCLREGLEIDCQKGCSWCCHQAVLVSTHEILLISQYLNEDMPDKLQSMIRTNASAKAVITGNMSVQEFLLCLHPCPFLDNGSCLIYRVRPMACRCYLSSDADSCHAQYQQPGNRQIIAALYDFPLLAVRSINEGIRAVLLQSNIITSEWLLEVLITKTFETPSIFNEWLSGEDPYSIRELTAEENIYLREYRNRKESSEEGD